MDRSFRDHRLVSTQYNIEQPVVHAGGWRVLAPFKFREYRLLIAAVSLSIFAEGMWAVVMALQVIELDNNPASLSLVATAKLSAWSRSSWSAGWPPTESASAPSSSASRPSM